MNRILFFTSLQVLFGSIILVVFKTQGYTMAALFAQPSQYFPLVLPIAIIFGIFSMVLAIFHKSKNKIDLSFKVIAVILIASTAIYNAFSPWIYISCGTYLQFFLLGVNLLLYVSIIILFSIIKYGRHNENKSKK